MSAGDEFERGVAEGRRMIAAELVASRKAFEERHEKSTVRELDRLRAMIVAYTQTRRQHAVLVLQEAPRTAISTAANEAERARRALDRVTDSLVQR